MAFCPLARHIYIYRREVTRKHKKQELRIQDLYDAHMISLLGTDGRPEQLHHHSKGFLSMLLTVSTHDQLSTPTLCCSSPCYCDHHRAHIMMMPEGGEHTSPQTFAQLLWQCKRGREHKRLQQASLAMGWSLSTCPLISIFPRVCGGSVLVGVIAPRPLTLQILQDVCQFLLKLQIDNHHYFIMFSVNTLGPTPVP